MATVIDALVVTLGLDPGEFEKGRRAASEGHKKLREDAEKTEKGFAKLGKTTEETFEGMARKGLAFFAVLAGAKSVEDFTTRMIGSDAALGRFAKTLGTTPGNLAALTMAVERNGGSADAAAGSFRGLSDSFENIKISGNDGVVPMLQKLQGAGGKAIEITKGFNAALPGISENLKVLKDQGRAVDADFFARSLGIDPETAIFLEQGWSKVSAEVEKSKKIGVPDEKWVEQAQQLLQLWRTLQQTAYQLGRTLVEQLGPQMIAVVNSQEWKDFVGSVSNPATWRPLLDFIHQLGSDENWKDVKRLFGWFRGQIHEIIQAIKFVDIITSSGFRNGEAWSKLSEDWDKAHGLGADGGGGGSVTLPGAGGTGLRAHRYGGAGNAAIRQRSRSYRDTTNYTGDNASVLRQAAANLGTTPEDLATVIGYETRGTFSPHIWGGKGGNYMGLIQFGAPERAMYGANDRQSFAEQMPAVVSYLKSRGYRPGMSLLDLYSTINAGRPGLYNASDGYGTVASHVARMRLEQAANVRRFLGSSSRPTLGAQLAVPNAMKVYQGVSGGDANNYTFHGAPSISNSHEVSVGAVHVHTTASDGEGIAKTIKPALERHSYAIQANYGPA